MFWPRLEKKTFWRIFKIFRPTGCKKKRWAFASSSSWKTENTSKIFKAEFSETLHCQCMSSSDFVNKHCCPFKCFIEWYRNCLDCLSRSLSYRFSDLGFQSHMNIACRSTQNAPCIIWIWILEVKCKRKWFIDLFLLVFIQTLEVM